MTVGVPGAAGGQVVHIAATDQTGWISFGLLLKACVSMTHGPTRRTWVPRAGGVSESCGTISACMVVAKVPRSEESTWMSKLQSPSVSWDRELLRETMVPVTTAQLDLMVSRLGSWTPALGSVRQAGSDAAVVPAESPPRAKAARARTASSGSGASQRRLRHNVAILPTPAFL